MSLIGVDLAWDRPTVAQIEAVGAHFVARYLSTDAKKNIRAAEVTAYKAAGLGTVVVWETTTGRATAGRAAGVADAQAAEAQRKAVGLPPDMVVHFAVDEDTTWASVSPYMAGAASVIGKARVGVYGGYQVIEGAAAAGYRYLWQTVAWSGGHWSSHATIRQPGGTTLSGGADWDTAMTPDYGQYPRPVPLEDIVTPDDIKAVATTTAQAVMTYEIDDPTRSGTQYMAFKDVVWWVGAHAGQAAAQIAAQSAAIAALAAHVGSGDDTATVVAAVQKAITDAIVHVDVTVTGNQPTP